MKRIGFLTVIVAFCVTAVAQKPVHTLILPEHALGVRGGVTLSSMTFEPNSSVTQPTWPIGMNLGLQYRMILEKYFGLWVELNYDQRGFTTTVDGENLTRRFDYIELPVLAHFTFGKRLFRFHFDLGPNIGYMIYDSGVKECSAPEHYLEVKNRFDWGVTGGVGVEFNTANAGIYTINARYNFGFGRVFARDYDTYITSGNQGIVINVGWMWKFKPKGGGYQAYDLRPKAKKKE